MKERHENIEIPSRGRPKKNCVITEKKYNIDYTYMNNEMYADKENYGYGNIMNTPHQNNFYNQNTYKNNVERSYNNYNPNDNFKIPCIENDIKEQHENREVRTVYGKEYNYYVNKDHLLNGYCGNNINSNPYNKEQMNYGEPNRIDNKYEQNRSFNNVHIPTEQKRVFYERPYNYENKENCYYESQSSPMQNKRYNEIQNKTLQYQNPNLHPKVHHSAFASPYMSSQHDFSDINIQEQMNNEYYDQTRTEQKIPENVPFIDPKVFKNPQNIMKQSLGIQKQQSIEPEKQSLPETEYVQPNHFSTSNWLTRKKRKNHSLFYHYVGNSEYPEIIPPSKLSSYDFINKNEPKKMFLGTVKRPNLHFEKTVANNTILPLYLNSSAQYDNKNAIEFEKIGTTFLRKTSGLDYENVTVQQLKILMKEFGLVHTGKKLELIDRVKHTVDVIKERLRSGGVFVEQTIKEDITEKNEEKNDPDAQGYDWLFF